MSNQERLNQVKQFLMNHLQNNKQTFRLNPQSCDNTIINDNIIHSDFISNLESTIIDNKYHVKFIPSSLKLSDIHFISAWNISSISMSCLGTLRIPVKIIINNKTYIYPAGVEVSLDILGVMNRNWDFIATIRSCEPDKYREWWGGRKTRKARYMRKKRYSTRGKSRSG